MKKIRWRSLAADLACDVAGSILFAMGIVTFASKAEFAPGGISGLALLVNHFVPIPIGIGTLLLNVPIILVSYPLLGRSFFLKSIRTMIVSTFFLDVVFPALPVYDGNRLMAAIFSGVCMGAGLSIIYMRGSSTGGQDFLIHAAKRKFPHISFGQLVMVMDGAVILAGWPVFSDVDAVLYGIVSVAAITVVMDKIMYGAGSGKLVVIVTDYGLEAARRIGDELDRGSTMVKAMGTYSGTDKQLLLCACSNREAYKVTAIVHQLDKSAMVMVCEASEVYGEGFRLPDGH